jgi:hypothetical protein
MGPANWNAAHRAVIGMITMDEQSGSLDGSCLMFFRVNNIENPVRLISVCSGSGVRVSMSNLSFESDVIKNV